MSDAGGRWVTINGARVFIKDGQSVDEAFSERKKNAWKDAAKTVKANGGLNKEQQRLLKEMDTLTKNAKSQAEAKQITDNYAQAIKLAGEQGNKLDLSSKGAENLKGQAAPKDLPRVTDDDAKHNKEVEYQGQKYQTQNVVDWDKERNASYVAGHLYVPVNPSSLGSHSSFFVAKDGSMWQSGSQYLNHRVESRSDVFHMTQSDMRNRDSMADYYNKKSAKGQAEAMKANPVYSQWHKQDGQTIYHKSRNAKTGETTVHPYKVTSADKNGNLYYKDAAGKAHKISPEESKKNEERYKKYRK